MTTVLVTGASGFVGGHLLQSAAGKWRLRVALRREGIPMPLNCTAVLTGPLSRRTDWSSALEGVECVVHLAAHVHVMHASPDDRQRFHEVNVLATERLAVQAAERGVKRFVFLSSIKVNGEATLDRPFAVTDLPAPVDDYGISKWEAERRLQEIAARSGMKVLTIRPPLVYGSGVRANFQKLLTLVNKGVPLPFAAVANRRSMVNVWNLCDLIAHAIDLPTVESGTFMVSDGRDLSTPELIRAIALQLKRPARLLHIPPEVLKLLGRMIGKEAEMDRLLGSLVVDIGDTRRRLGWEPPVSVEDGIAKTVHWFVNDRVTRHA